MDSCEEKQQTLAVYSAETDVNSKTVLSFGCTVTPMTTCISLQVTRILRSESPLAWNHLSLDYKSLLLGKKVWSNHCGIVGLSGNSCFHFVLLHLRWRSLSNATYRTLTDSSDPSTGKDLFASCSSRMFEEKETPLLLGRSVWRLRTVQRSKVNMKKNNF